MIDLKLTKFVNSVSNVEYEKSTDIYISGRTLTFSKCVRDDADDSFIDASNTGQYFSSVNLPTDYTQLTTGSTISLLYPELYQLLNTDRFILINLPKTGFTECIDAKSLTINFIYSDSNLTPSSQERTLYSSTFESQNQGESIPLLGNNIAFLFSDEFNRPYSGLTVNELGEVYSRSAITSWNPTENYKDRPNAISYKNVQSNINCLNTDKRKYAYFSNVVTPGYPAYIGTSIKFYSTQSNAGFLQLNTSSTHSFRTGDNISIDFITNPNLYNTGGTITSLTDTSITTNLTYIVPYLTQSGGVYYGNEGIYYNYDIPLGFVCLDKGLIVLSHKTLCDGFSFSDGVTDGFFENGTIVTGLFDLPLYNCYYTGNTSLNIQLTSLNKEFDMAVSCSSLLGEFYISNNHTWNKVVAQNTMGNIPPVQITEAGFYNAFGELVGISKFSEPIQKTQNDILSFDFKINM